MTEHAGHDDIRELLVPFALGELVDGELRRVQAALDASPELRGELAAIEETNARLIVGSVAHVAAPAALRGRVLDAIGAADRRAVEPDAAAAPAAATVHGPVVTPAAPSRRWRWPRIVVPALAGGFAVACIALGLVATSLNDDLDAANRRLDGLERRAAEARAASDSVPVSTHGDMAPASGQLIRIGSDRWVLLMRDVPDPGAGNSWQVWTADDDGNIRNVGQWVAGASSQALLVTEADIRQVMVSFETTEQPVPTPGSEPVMSVEV